MFGSCPVVRIEYDNEDGFCEINASDFDAAVHTLHDPEVVADDDTQSLDGMTVAQLREELVALGIDIPTGTHKKADLLALLKMPR